MMQTERSDAPLLSHKTKIAASVDKKMAQQLREFSVSSQHTALHTALGQVNMAGPSHSGPITGSAATQGSRFLFFCFCFDSLKKKVFD